MKNLYENSAWSLKPDYSTKCKFAEFVSNANLEHLDVGANIQPI
jgi:hypothetical protein